MPPKQFRNEWNEKMNGGMKFHSHHPCVVNEALASEPVMALAFRRGFRTSPHVFGTNGASMCAMLGLEVQFECSRLEIEIRPVCAQLRSLGLTGTTKATASTYTIVQTFPCIRRYRWCPGRGCCCGAKWRRVHYNIHVDTSETCEFPRNSLGACQTWKCRNTETVS